MLRNAGESNFVSECERILELGCTLGTLGFRPNVREGTILNNVGVQIPGDRHFLAGLSLCLLHGFH